MECTAYRAGVADGAAEARVVEAWLAGHAIAEATAHIRRVAGQTARGTRGAVAATPLAPVGGVEAVFACGSQVEPLLVKRDSSYVCSPRK